jgi:hypothetical protein
MLKDKLKTRRFERHFKKQGRKDLFTWVHRYLRLHNDLLGDSIYQKMYNYHRDTLIAYLKRDVKGKNTSDKEYGEMIDELADIFNRNSAERVNKYQSLVETLYNHWKENPALNHDIRI